MMAPNNNNNNSQNDDDDNNNDYDISALSNITTSLAEMAQDIFENVTAAIVSGNLADSSTTQSPPTDSYYYYYDSSDDVTASVYGGNATTSAGNVTQVTETFSSGQDPHHPVIAIVLLSLLFFVIVVVGIVGNALVIFVVIFDRKMRQSVTNVLILNLAVADLTIMMLGVPEIVQFMLDRGWVLGAVLCRLDRFLLVVCLYSSVLSLVSLCIERFIAIVFPIKAHVVCTRRKVLCIIAVIWPVSILCGLPTAVFNELTVFPDHSPDKQHCVIIFPEPHLRYFKIYKLLESAFFYFLPLAVQVTLYAVVARRLYASMEELHTRFQMRSGDSASSALNGGGSESRNGAWSGGSSCGGSSCGAGAGGGGGGGGGGAERGNDRAVETIRARKGVVKMLVASVVVYTISYSPHQFHLLYNSIASHRLPETWIFFVFVMVMTHINSAANPVLYSIFSQNFRRNFKRYLCYVCYVQDRYDYMRARFDSFDSRGVSRRASTTKTFVTRV